MFVHMLLLCFFFFKQKTAYEMRISDWSSDVCSSDLPQFEQLPAVDRPVILCVSGMNLDPCVGKKSGRLLQAPHVDKRGITIQDVRYLILVVHRFSPSSP